jgi:hypothetical protein
MTNPRAVVPHIEELIILVPREKAGNIHPEEAKRLQQVRNDLTRFFTMLEEQIRARPTA